MSTRTKTWDWILLYPGKTTDLEEYEPNILAGLIKLFIREMTDSVLPDEIAQRFEEAAGMFIVLAWSN